ncbi:MAG: type II toxin-antitoxin system RelE/ParE family toxin [Elusimicrobia bacterium]|nr:type II toxin-antitoxin system RelE/ParE family toxin [Elusimicrobiota bacterium]
MYKVELSRQAEKDLERVFRSDKKLYQRFVAALGTIARDPIAEGKPLHGELKGLRSHRFGSYRILYEIRRGELLVLVIDLGHRRGIYE